MPNNINEHPNIFLEKSLTEQGDLPKLEPNQTPVNVQQKTPLSDKEIKKSIGECVGTLKTLFAFFYKQTDGEIKKQFQKPYADGKAAIKKISEKGGSNVPTIKP
jgi:hypothetical protein